MQPLEFGVHSDLESRDTTGIARPAHYPARHGAIKPWHADPPSVVARFLTVADYEAAAITQQASYQAAMITRQVAYEAAEIREAARREAGQIRQQAAVQAAAVREAAEKEAAGVRMAVMSMQTELSELATRITDTFPNLAGPRMPPIERPAVSPAASPSPQPQARPPTAPAEKPAGKPAARPARRSATRPANRPASSRGRQVTAMRFTVIATSALFLMAVVTGVMEIHLHGFDFFIFRSAGTGQTRHSGLQENQGPGQPDAPKQAPSQIKARPGPHRQAGVDHGH